MNCDMFSYRYALEILEHKHYRSALKEILAVVRDCPLFIYSNKSKKNRRLDVVQHVMNTYFDRRFVLDFGWEYHPLATKIEGSGLSADFRKAFGKDESLAVQSEVQFGNMARWYSDIFKFQTAYSQNLVQMGLSIVPKSVLSRRIDSNIVNYERALRELPSAVLSITLPILLIGIYPDKSTPIIDLSKTRFSAKELTGRGQASNRWRIVNAFQNGIDMRRVGRDSEIGPNLGKTDTVEIDSEQE